MTFLKIISQTFGSAFTTDMLKDLISQSPIWGIKIPKPLLYQVKALSMLETLHTLYPEIGFEELLDESFQEVTSILNLKPLLLMELGKKRSSAHFLTSPQLPLLLCQAKGQKTSLMVPLAFSRSFSLLIFGVGFIILPQSTHLYWLALWLFASAFTIRR